MSNWNASNYLDRKAQRAALEMAQVKPRWVTNPQTGEEFFLRKVSGLTSSLIAGYMPAGLTQTAVDAWREKGVKGLEADNLADVAATLTPEQREAGNREMKALARIIQQACVIPLLVSDHLSAVEFTDEWKQLAIAGLKEKDKDFDPETFNPNDLVFSAAQLDDKDSAFLINWAKGFDMGVLLKGGNVVSAENFRAVRKKLNRGSRAGADVSKVQQAS